MSRRKGRILAFQALYSWDVSQTPVEDLLKFSWTLNDDSAAEEIEDFQESVAECIDDMMDALDRLKELICSFPVPDEEPYPFNPTPTSELTPTDGKELPF